jgi:uncharacterized membrane protein YgaE (UPF0421/DUF939 family)
MVCRWWYGNNFNEKGRGRCMKIHIGMRKIKSLIALVASFAIWQLIRLFLPMLETHPLFAYIYSVIELRETPDKTKAFGKLRIKATFIGLIVGLVFITLSVYAASEINVETLRILTELLFILLAIVYKILYNCIGFYFKEFTYDFLRKSKRISFKNDY